MKSQSLYRTLACAILIVILTGCASPASQPAPTPTTAPKSTPTENPNVGIVLDMVAKLNAGDAEGSLAYFADDAVAYFMGFPPTGIEVYSGKEQIRPVFEDSVANHFEWEVEVTSAEDGIITTKAKTWHDFTRMLEVAPLEYIDVYEVKDGKIVTYGTWLTEESLARFKPAFAEVVPPEPTPEPSNETPATEMSVTIADDTCVYEGPMTLKAGELTVHANVEDQDQEKYAVSLFTLDVGKDILDLMVSTIEAGPPEWADTLFLKELDPGESETYENFQVDEGMLYLVCWSGPPDMAIGNAGPLTVVP